MYRFRYLITILLLASLVGISLPAHADISSTHYKILNPTLSPGGTGTSASYKLSATEGEVAHNGGTSTSYKLQLGFFSFPVVTAPVVSSVVGNASGRVDLS